MRAVIEFLTNFSALPLLGIFLSLAVGYIVGKIKIGSFTVGPTLGTLITAFVLSRFLSFSVPGIVESIFSILFCFTLGYEAGPMFFKSLRSQGVKFVFQAVFFCGSSCLVLYLLGAFGVFEKGTILGMAAGALTQSSILAVAGDIGDMGSVSFAVTYITGTVFAILFASFIAPKLLRTDVHTAVKDNVKKNSKKIVSQEEDTRALRIFSRAFLVQNGSPLIGKNVEYIEDKYRQALQFSKIFRDGKSIEFDQSTVVLENDIVMVISPTKYLINIDDEYIVEVDDRKYTDIDIVSKEIYVTEETQEKAVDLLSKFGVVLQKVTFKGKKLEITDDLVLHNGAVIKVSGTGAAVQKVAGMLGYIKDVGTATDVPFVFFAIFFAVIVGSFKVGVYSLGGATCALIAGLICGWYSGRKPKYGNFPDSARWFLKSVGLNMFIASKALTTESFKPSWELLIIVAVGIAVTLVPHILSALFSKYVLKMDNADILGGQCGSGTCTAALNSLTDTTGSSVFTTAFATTNAVSNILLTVVGGILAGLL